MRKYLLILATIFAVVPMNGWAKERCDDSKREALAIEEAYESADLVLIGHVKEMTWKGSPKKTKFKTEVGLEILLNDHIDSDSPDQPFDPKTAPRLNYKTTFAVQEIIKGKTYLQNNKIVEVYTSNGGWGGFQFDTNSEYLVYARYLGASKNNLWTDLCSRTRPVIYATDDLSFFKHLNRRK